MLPSLLLSRHSIADTRGHNWFWIDFRCTIAHKTEKREKKTRRFQCDTIEIVDEQWPGLVGLFEFIRFFLCALHIANLYINKIASICVLSAMWSMIYNAQTFHEIKSIFYIEQRTDKKTRSRNNWTKQNAHNEFILTMNVTTKCSVRFTQTAREKERRGRER